MPDNETRATRAAVALAQYEGDIETRVIDLLTDALHWAGSNGQSINLQDAALLADIHFDAERMEG